MEQGFGLLLQDGLDFLFGVVVGGFQRAFRRSREEAPAVVRRQRHRGGHAVLVLHARGLDGLGGARLASVRVPVADAALSRDRQQLLRAARGTRE